MFSCTRMFWDIIASAAVRTVLASSALLNPGLRNGARGLVVRQFGVHRGDDPESIAQGLRCTTLPPTSPNSRSHIDFGSHHFGDNGATFAKDERNRTTSKLYAKG